jgi:hypothetical protein
MTGELHTEKGLRFFGFGFMTSVFAYLIMFIMVIAILVTLPSQEEDSSTIYGTFGFSAPFFWMVIAFAMVAVVFFISFIFFLLGLISLNRGRWEFGPIHAASNQRGAIFVFIGFILILSGGVFGILGSAFGIIAIVMISFGLLSLINEITDETGKRMLLLAAVLFIIISVITAIITLWLFFSTFLYDSGMNSYMVSAIIPMGVSATSIIPVLLFHFAYRRTYFRVKNREIMPVPVPPPMMPYPAGYPPYYPPYPPPYPPPYYPPPYQQQYYPPTTPPPTYPQHPQNIGIKPQGIRICKKCGSKVPSGVAICPSCNTPL